MSSIVCTTQADADAYAAAIDSKLGYPKPGIDMGPGTHAPPAQTRTMSYATVQKHPTLALWAYPNDPVVQTQALTLPVGATVQTLDATWTPAQAIAGQALQADAEKLP